MRWLSLLLASPPAAMSLRHAPVRAMCSDASLDAWPFISSPTNARLKLVKKLHAKRQRDKSGLMLLEGHRLVIDALATGAKPEFVLLDEGALITPAGEQLRAALAQLEPDRVLRAPPELIAQLSGTETPQGVLAVTPQQPRPLPRAPTLALVCDSIADPGNLGTLLRSASGAGVGAVLLTPGCSDPWGLKALRAGMGAQLRLPVASVSSWRDAARMLGEWGCAVFAADAAGEVVHSNIDWTVPAALVVGSEAHGLSQEVRDDLAVTLCRIPLSAAVSADEDLESLNAAVAGSIVLFEAQRQRLL